MAARRKPDHIRKIQVCYRIPRWIVDWLRTLNKPASVAIEEALIQWGGLEVPDVGTIAGEGATAPTEGQRDED